LGFHYGCFLLKYNFNIQASLEEHDVYHVIGTGILFYPFEYKSFYKKYQKGKKAHQFYDLNFYKMLSIPLSTLQQTFNIQLHEQTN